MENANIGIVNLIISNKLKDSYFNNMLIEESKKVAFDFFDVVKSSPILQLEFKVFNNLEGKHIDNDIIATRYIDNNIKLFEIYTIDEINKEREKLKPFIVEGIVSDDDDKVQLYNAIDTLIKESLNDNDKIDIDKIHESFTLVLNRIKEPAKKELLENVDVKPVDEDVIEIAVDKFNEKYDTLNEEDKNLLKTLIKSNDKEKQALLETYKTESLAILEGVTKESAKEGVAKAIQKIKEMVYKKDNVEDNIISLHELKKELL
jgi:hypothetical protein